MVARYSLREMNRRQHSRVPLGLAVLCVGEHTRSDGRVTNLSMGGCAVQSAATVPAGLPVKLRLSFPYKRGPLEVELAIVRWSRDGTCGLQFIIVSTKAQERLRLVVSNVKPPTAQY